MNWVDIFLVAVIILSVISGWYKGFIRGTADLICWAGSLLIAYLYYPYSARGLEKLLHPGIWLLPIAFLLTAFGARLLLGWLIRFITRTIPESANQHGFNRFLGVIPGAINGWIYSIILSALLLSLPIKDSITRETRNSRFAGPLAQQSEWANSKLTPVFGDAVRQTMNSLTINPSSKEKVPLKFNYDKAEARPALEAAMLQMVNQASIANGLKPLLPDPEMTNVARAHSADMFVNGYFAHVNLEGKDPFDRMKMAQVNFFNAGENLAMAPTLEMAHTNLMNSPGHRANILNPGFGRLGIGILDGGYYGLMISQEFRD